MRYILTTGRYCAILINSQTNFRVKQWLKLKDKFNRDKQKRFLVHGYHLVAEAFSAGLIEEVICTIKPNEAELLLSKSRMHNANRLDAGAVPIYQVTNEVMEKLTVMAVPQKIMGVSKQNAAASINGNVVLVNAVHHPGNLGTIIRNAAAFDVDTIVLESSVDVYNPKVVQAPQGMVFHVNILKCPLGGQINDLKNRGYQIIGTDVKNGKSLKDFLPQKNWGLLLGSESEGLNSTLLNMCDEKIKIDMHKKCESLNVGVAAGIILNSFYAA